MRKRNSDGLKGRAFEAHASSMGLKCRELNTEGKSGREAIREDQRTVRMVRINIAVNECLRSLFDIGTNAERIAEQKEILCVLNDLRVMIHLYRKYAWRLRFTPRLTKDSSPDKV